MSGWCEGILWWRGRSEALKISMQIFGLTTTVIFYYHNRMLLHAVEFKFCFRSFFTVMSLFLMRQSHKQSSDAKEDIERLL